MQGYPAPPRPTRLLDTRAARGAAGATRTCRVFAITGLKTSPPAKTITKVTSTIKVALPCNMVSTSDDKLFKLLESLRKLKR